MRIFVFKDFVYFHDCPSESASRKRYLPGANIRTDLHCFPYTYRIDRTEGYCTAEIYLQNDFRNYLRSGEIKSPVFEINIEPWTVQPMPTHILELRLVQATYLLETGFNINISMCYALPIRMDLEWDNQKQFAIELSPKKKKPLKILAAPGFDADLLFDRLCDLTPKDI